MKRMQAACIALLLCVFTAFPCAAAAKAETKTIDVYARAVRESDAYTAPAEDGEASVKLNDGTSVTVSGVPEDGLWLVVYPIPETEEDARDWLESCMEGYGTGLYPMEIYFIDQDGNRVSVSRTVTVTVKTPRKYENPIVCRISTGGKVTVLDGSADGKRISFRMDRSGYYVLAEKKEDSGSDSGGHGSSGGKTAHTSGTISGDGSGGTAVAGLISPATGDDSGIWLWMVLLGMSAAGAAVIWKRRRRSD